MPRLIPMLGSVLVGLLVLSACSSGPAGVPGGSSLVGEGAAPLSAVAPADGAFFLRAANAQSPARELPVKKGQRLEVGPGGAILLDARPAGQPISGAVEIYFKPATRREYHPTYNP